MSVHRRPPPHLGPSLPPMTYGLRDLDGVRIELCDECGFDERDGRDLATAFAEVYASLEELQAHPEAGRRPEPDTWSGAEYAEHCVDGTDQTLAICRRAVALPESTSVVSLSEAAAATARLIGELTDPQWNAVTDGWSFDVHARRPAFSPRGSRLSRQTVPRSSS